MNELEKLLNKLHSDSALHTQQIKGLNELTEKIRKEVNRLSAAAHQGAARPQYEEAEVYNSKVMTVGYAGFFGLWSLVKDLQFDWQQLFNLAGLLGLVSLAVFVFWEVMTMGVRVVIISPSHAFGGPTGFKRRLAAWVDRWLNTLWGAQFLIAMIFGLAACGCLGFVLASNLARSL